MPDTMVGLPTGLVARPPTPADLTDVVAVIRADEVAERGEADTSHADIEGDWERPSFDLATQALVVEDADGTIVGYAEQLGGRTNVNVAPDHHGRGIGSALLDWAEARAAAEGQPYVGQTVLDANTAAIRMHLERGHRVRWETWLYGIDLDGDIARTQPPDGYRLRQLELDRDAREAFDVIEAAFNTWSDRDPSDFADWRASYWDRSDIDPRHYHGLEDGDGTLVGVLLGLVEDGGGMVDQLAVLPTHHGRGLGKVLLQRAFAGFAEDGATMAMLSTESRGSAKGFYEAAGMRLVRSFTRFVRDLD